MGKMKAQTTFKQKIRRMRKAIMRREMIKVKINLRRRGFYQMAQEEHEST